VHHADDVKSFVISGRTHAEILDDYFISALANKTLSFFDVSSGIDDEPVMRKIFFHREAN